MFKILRENDLVETVRCEVVMNQIPTWQLTTDTDGKEIRVRGTWERRPDCIWQKYQDPATSASCSQREVLGNSTNASSNPTASSSHDNWTYPSVVPTEVIVEDEVKEPPLTPEPDSDEEFLIQEEFAKRLEAKSDFPFVTQMKLPRDPAEPMEQNAFMGRADHEFTVLSLKAHAKDLKAYLEQLHPMVKSKDNIALFDDSTQLPPGKQAKRERIDKLVELVKGELSFIRGTLNRLRRHARVIQVNLEAPVKDETDLKVPSKIYNFLFFLEARAIQRARNHQEDHGYFFAATYRQWRRKLYFWRTTDGAVAAAMLELTAQV